MGGSDPTIPADTLADDSDVLPSLAAVAELVPEESTRHLIRTSLARGATPDGVTKGVTAWLVRIIDWRAAGIPSGRLGTQGQSLLADAVRVWVDVVDRSRQPPSRPTGTTHLHRGPHPRPPPVPVGTRTVEARPLACPPDPADDR